MNLHIRRLNRASTSGCGERDFVDVLHAAAESGQGAGEGVFGGCEPEWGDVPAFVDVFFDVEGGLGIR